MTLELMETKQTRNKNTKLNQKNTKTHKDHDSIENLNRDSFERHRTSRSSRSSSEHKRGPTDSYGCTRFQPELPPEKTHDTVEEKCQRLEEIYTQEGAVRVEKAEVSSLMETTFCLQRRHISAVPFPSIEDLRCCWPYLFHQKSFFAHFQLLTDLDVLRLLELAMVECGRAIIEYFRSKPTKMSKMFSPRVKIQRWPSMLSSC